MCKLPPRGIQNDPAGRLCPINGHQECDCRRRGRVPGARLKEPTASLDPVSEIWASTKTSFRRCAVPAKRFVARLVGVEGYGPTGVTHPGWRVGVFGAGRVIGVWNVEQLRRFKNVESLVFSSQEKDSICSRCAYSEYGFQNH